MLTGAQFDARFTPTVSIKEETDHLAACAGGGARSTTTDAELAEDAFRFSRFPLVEKYNWRLVNWRLVKWEMTSYYGGTWIEASSPVNTYDILRNTPTSKGGRWWQTLYRLHYGRALRRGPYLDPTHAPKGP